MVQLYIALFYFQVTHGMQVPGLGLSETCLLLGALEHSRQHGPCHRCLQRQRNCLRDRCRRSNGLPFSASKKRKHGDRCIIIIAEVNPLTVSHMKHKLKTFTSQIALALFWALRLRQMYVTDKDILFWFLSVLYVGVCVNGCSVFQALYHSCSEQDHCTPMMGIFSMAQGD